MSFHLLTIPIHRSAYNTIRKVSLVSRRGQECAAVLQESERRDDRLISVCKMDWLFSSLDILFDFPRWYVGAVLGTGFFTYYLREAVKVGLITR